jgi:hypothetical protein
LSFHQSCHNVFIFTAKISLLLFELLLPHTTHFPELCAALKAKRSTIHSQSI